MSVRQILRLREEGVSIIFVAITIALLFGFAAVAVDAMGIGSNARRQAQSSADVGALTAVQFATTVDLGNGCAGTPVEVARCNGASEAIEVANATLDDPALADWNDASRCVAPPAGYTSSPTTACVAFSVNNRSAWVQIPTFDQPTALARVVGINSIAITAEAIAGTDFLVEGAILPFLLLGDSSAPSYGCLKAHGVPDFGECADLPGTGNFGALDFYMYGDLEGDHVRCIGDENGRFVTNIARGVDHLLGVYTDSSLMAPALIDRDLCPLWDPLRPPNSAFANTGVGSALEDGLAYGGTDYSVTPYPGRIAGSLLVRAPQGAVRPAVTLDDTPLWDYLIDDGSLTGTYCDPAFALTPPASEMDGVNGVSNPLEMESCINWAKSGSPTVIFDGSIRNATRYGWTPEVWETTFYTGTSDAYHIREYLPVYIDTTFFGCNDNECSIMHTPGVADSGLACPSNPMDSRITCGLGGPAPGNALQAVTAWVLGRDIVPQSARSPVPGDPNQLTYNLVR